MRENIRSGVVAIYEKVNKNDTNMKYEKIQIKF